MFSGRGETQQELLRTLKRHPAGLGAEGLALALRITRTAVRQHLAALGRDGLIVKTSSVPSGGRPSHLYGLSEEAREAFPRQYSWFSEVLVEALRDKLGRAGLERTLRAMGRDAASAMGASDKPLADRAEGLVTQMTQLGYEAKVNAPRRGAIEVSASNCVFHQLALRNPEVCQFDLGLIEQATGTKVSHQECIVRGGHTCRFRLDPKTK